MVNFNKWEKMEKTIDKIKSLCYTYIVNEKKGAEKVEKIVKILLILLVIILLVINKKLDDDFIKDCTQNHSISYCQAKM